MKFLNQRNLQRHYLQTLNKKNRQNKKIDKMKTLTDTLLESKTNPREIKNYSKSWMTSASNYDEAAQLVKTLMSGLLEGAQENYKYADNREKADWSPIISNLKHTIEFFENE